MESVFLVKLILSFFAGALWVVFATLLAEKYGTKIGGLFSMFPAMFTSTILITYFSRGPLFSAATMKSTMLSGVSIVAYSIIARYTYLNFGIIEGTLVSLVASFAIGCLIYNYLIKRSS